MKKASFNQLVALSLKMSQADLHSDLAKALLQRMGGTMMRVNSECTSIHKLEGTLVRLMFHAQQMYTFCTTMLTKK
jgi:Tfp pilus assembly pilus retraction ATPase PilT